MGERKEVVVVATEADLKYLLSAVRRAVKRDGCTHRVLRFKCIVGNQFTMSDKVVIE